MISITIPKSRLFDDKDSRFIDVKETTLVLEHSLVSVRKWESKFKKPFLKETPRTEQESIEYIKCMTITQNVNPMVYLAIPTSEQKRIAEYINESMTATTFKDGKQGTFRGKHRGNKNGQFTTCELIYASMFELGIPLECEKWHLNQLLTLIRVCSERQQPSKKMKKKDVMKSNSALNAARRKSLNTSG